MGQRNAQPQIDTFFLGIFLFQMTQLIRFRSKYCPQVLSITDHSNRVSSTFSSFLDRGDAQITLQPYQLSQT